MFHKPPVVDYRRFRLSKLNEPEFSHLKLLGGWIFYFLMYFITENLIPASSCHPIHCALDDLIPFNELFVIPYVFWYVLVGGSLLYYLLYNVEGFKRLQLFIILTQVIAMTIYVLYPSRQDLRPETFQHHNFLTWIMGLIYAFDTPTGVCPSLHVGYSLGILSVVLKDREVPRYWKGVLVAVVITICCAVCFVKQHSAVDVAAAIPMCVVCEAIVWRDWWAKQFKRNKAKRKIV